MCLNIASFAYRRPKDDDIEECLRDVFAYMTDDNFLRKSRHYIAQIAIKRVVTKIKIPAAFPIHDAEYF